MPKKMSKKPAGQRRTFTDEYKAEVIRLCGEPGRTAYSVARELGLAASIVTRWVRQADVDRGGGGSGALTTAEREELAALRYASRTKQPSRRELENRKLDLEITAVFREHRGRYGSPRIHRVLRASRPVSRKR